jgi:hypothetical protein
VLLHPLIGIHGPLGQTLGCFAVSKLSDRRYGDSEFEGLRFIQKAPVLGKFVNHNPSGLSKNYSLKSHGLQNIAGAELEPVTFAL